MSENDPFAEPSDTEQTVIKPNPLGRRAAPPRVEPMVPPEAPTAETVGIGVPPRAAAQASPEAVRPSEPSITHAMTGMNTLNACAAPLFALVSRISNRAQHPNPDNLRKSVVAEVRAFENRALQAGVDSQTVRVARYAICATLDDVVLNTPWGGQSVWTMQSMVGTFHKENVGGDRFYDLLARLEREPGKNIDLLEFLYMCLSLGFEGRLRVEPGGSDKHLQIRNGLAKSIRGQRGPTDRDVSPHWKGVERPHRPLSAWLPIWTAVGALAAILGLGFFGLVWALSGSSNQLLGQLSGLESSETPTLLRRAPPPPPPAEPVGLAQLEVVKKFLEAEIDEGLVTVLDGANTITIRIVGDGMFGSASDTLQPDFAEPLARVAAALDDQHGPIIVAGHSDSVPIRTARFPSNMHLSLARAEKVMETFASRLEDPIRLSAEGRAEKEPIASNETAEGRAMNRRIEVVLIKVGHQ